MFIELTREGGRKVLVNTDHLLYATFDKVGTVYLHFTDGSDWQIQEKADEFRSLLEPPETP